MLNKNHPLPIYYQLKEFLRDQIVTGKLQPGDAVPSERKLSETYQISRMTARQAMTELTTEGLLRREQGKGTFVAEPKIKQKLTRLTGFTEDTTTRGLQVGTQVLRFELISAPASAAQALDIAFKQHIVLLERLRFVNGIPLAIETCYLNINQMQAFLQEDFAENSLYQVLTNTYSVVPTRAEQQVEADLCNRHQQQLLKLSANAPVLKNKRTTFDQWNRPFEYTESVYRGDRYIFHAELVIQNKGGK